MQLVHVIYHGGLYTYTLSITATLEERAPELQVTLTG